MDQEGWRYSVVPAEPGWRIVVPAIDRATGRVVELSRVPVVAWAIEIYESDPNQDPAIYTRPVAPEAFGLQAEILQRPDGTIVFLKDREFTDEAEALAYAREWYAKREAGRRRYREAGKAQREAMQANGSD